jgi:long-chain acyl-CoA synthetase
MIIWTILAFRGVRPYGRHMGSTTVAGLLRTHATERPGHPALTAGAVTLTFDDLDRRATRCANALAAEGVSAQDRVAFFGKNAPEFFEVLFGAAKLNAVMVAVNWRLAAPEVAFILQDARPTVLVVTEELLPVLESAHGALSSVKRVVVVDAAAGGHAAFRDWVGAATDDDPTVEAAPDDVALQLYTSGTTGRPKGAMLTNRNLAAMLPVTSREWCFDGDSVNLVAMPLFHVGGVGWALVGMFVGAHSVLLRDVDPAEILRVIPRHGITHALFVPAVLQILLASPGIEETDFSSLRFVIYGASPISVDVLSRSLARFGCGFIQGYGLTETTGAVVQLLAEDHDPSGPNVHRLRAAGKPMPGTELRIVDERSGEDRLTGEVGEVVLRSPQIMQAYWERPDETQACIDPDGWFHTGDAGYVDDDGYLFINDRVKDMIISGGENIYPGEVENVLMSHAAVADVAVIGVPSERWGETPKAIVVRAPAATPTPEELLAHCRGQLAGYKIPTSVEFVDELPRNAAGKVLKRELRARYWEQHDRAVH